MLLGPQEGKNHTKKWIRLVEKIQVLGVTLRAHNNTHTRYYDNFKGILDKMRVILGQWKNRNLSIKGKTVVVNSLIISLLSYMSSVVYTPPRVIRETKSMICNYIWSDRRSKISYNTLIQKTEFGGLKLTDLDARIKASYVQWVRRLVKLGGCLNSDLAKIALQWPYDIMRLFQTKGKQKECYKETFSFYHKLISVWQEVHSYYPLEASEIKSESLWNNFMVADARGPMTVKDSWARKGLWLVGDLLGEEGFLSHVQISDRYGIDCTFLDLLAIRQKLPPEWKHFNYVNTPKVKGEIEIYVNLDNSSPSLDKIKVSTIYWDIVAKQGQSMSAMTKWELEFPELFTSDRKAKGIWREVFLLPYKVQKETKYQSLQYKILARITPCNVYLQKVKIRDSDLCDFCEVKDDWSHFFIHCMKCKILWKAIFRWYNQCSNEDYFMPGDSDIIFGILNKDKRTDYIILNVIILMTKNFIHWKKLYFKGEMCITEWFLMLKRWIDIECGINRKKGKPRLPKGGRGYVKPWGKRDVAD